MHTKVVLLLLGLVARAVLAEFTYTVTATHMGKPVKASDIILERIDPGRHQLNTTVSRRKPKLRPGHERRTNPAQESSNWCGASQHSPLTNPITSVKAYFQVPTLSPRPGITGFPQYVAPWVGIDGATYWDALLQSGTNSEIDSAGVQTNHAWFEWVPDAAFNVPSFPVSAGDWIQVIVSAPSATSGTIYIENISQAYDTTLTLNNGTPLERVDADWIVEDPQGSSGTFPFAVFTDTWFEECAATTSNSTTLGINGANMYYLSNDWCTTSEYDNANFLAYSP